MAEYRLRDTRENRRGVQDQFRTILRRARELFADVDRETFNRRPGPERWSAGECIEHLNTTARTYLPALTDAIISGRGRGGSRRSGRTLVGRLLAWLQEPPPRFHRRARVELMPAQDLDPADVLEDFEALYEEVIVRVNESRDLDRRKIRVRSVLNPFLRLKLDDWFAYLAAHARRHLWQAAETLKEVRRAR